MYPCASPCCHPSSANNKGIKVSKSYKTGSQHDLWYFQANLLLRRKKNVSISLSRVVICVLDIIDITKFTQLSIFAVKVDPWVPSIHDNFKSKVSTIVKQKKWTPPLLDQFFIIRNFVTRLKKIPPKVLEVYFVFF